MRYIDLEGVVIPKHCKYGPRPAEGIVFNDYEWWSITDHLVKDQREKELAAVLRAKQEAKRDISFNMTRNWSNTLASIKTQGNQKRMEKLEKEKQDKVDQYHQILKNRKEEKKGILADVKKMILEEKNAVKTINSALLSCVVLDERRKQIELKNNLKSEQAKKDEEWELKDKKDFENYEREQFEEKIKQQGKLNAHKQFLDKQIAELKQQREAEDDAAAKEQDLKKMKLEGEKIHHCNMAEKNYRKNFAARYMRKTENQLEYERIVDLEEEEENEVNKIYIEYNKRFEKERKKREARIREEEVERREKISQMLAQKLEEVRAKEECLLSLIESKDDEMAKEEERRKEKEKKALEELLEGKKQAEERRKRELREEKEREKWEIFQVRKTLELHKQKEAERQRKEETKRQELLKILDAQIKEKKEREEEEIREMETPLEDEEAEREEMQTYCQDVLDFIKEKNLPDGPIQKTLEVIKKEYGIVDKKESSEKQNQQSGAKQQNDAKQKSRSMGIGCYCFKY